jgi:Mg-chelatase subunit ChlD
VPSDTPGATQLYTRVINVDTNVFDQFKVLYPQPPLSGGGGGAGPVQKEIQLAFRDAGVDLKTNAGEFFFYDSGGGKLTVRAPLNQLDKIETATRSLSNPQQEIPVVYANPSDIQQALSSLSSAQNPLVQRETQAQPVTTKGANATPGQSPPLLGDVAVLGNLFRSNSANIGRQGEPAITASPVPTVSFANSGALAVPNGAKLVTSSASVSGEVAGGNRVRGDLANSKQMSSPQLRMQFAATPDSLVAEQKKTAAPTLVQDGKLLFEMGKLDEAEAKLKAASKANPSNQAANYYLGLINEHRRDEANNNRDVRSREKLLEVQHDWYSQPDRQKEPPAPAPAGQAQPLHGDVAVLGNLFRSNSAPADKVAVDGTKPAEVALALPSTPLTIFAGGAFDGFSPGPLSVTNVQNLDEWSFPGASNYPSVGWLGRTRGNQLDHYMVSAPQETSQLERKKEPPAHAPGLSGPNVASATEPQAVDEAILRQATRLSTESGREKESVARARNLERQLAENEAKISAAQSDVERLRQDLQVSVTALAAQSNVDGLRPKPSFQSRLAGIVNRAAAPGELNLVKEKDSDKAPSKPVASADAPVPQPEIQTRDNAFSTFSMNVSDVSFKLAAASLEKGMLPEPASVRSEEFINAFDYRDPEAPPGAPVAFAYDRAGYPFAQNRDLLRFSIKTAAEGREPGRPLNLVLLLDTSGSMERADRVRIIHEALRVLAAQLTPNDVFSVVTFARTPRLWVDGIPGHQAGKAAEEVGNITPEGGTNLEEAMNLAYQTALRHYLANGVNHVVLLTDGAANLGNVDPAGLKQKVEANRKQGISLDCFGVGWEGYNDDLLEVLTRDGNGRYGFINTPEEAATDFAGQLAGALRVAAADVKVQVEFNPTRVTAYRQIGYAKHQLTKEQFRDNTVAAAQLAAAESGNALYVVEVNPRGEGPLCTVRVRYRVPATDEYHEHEWAVPYSGNAPALEQSAPAMKLAATAAAFSEWLAASPYAADVTPGRLLGCLSGVPEICGADARPKKLEWMLRQALSIEGKR